MHLATIYQTLKSFCEEIAANREVFTYRKMSLDSKTKKKIKKEKKWFEEVDSIL